MYLCTGGELFYHLTKFKIFSEDLARFYVAEVLLALEYLHDKGIVYRDLKPENVLLDIDGHVRLADFGLCKQLTEPNSLAFSFCGSPEYMSPEMLRRIGHGRTLDFYSLGALLFELLTGLPPFYSPKKEQMFKNVLEEAPVFPSWLSEPAI